LLFLQILRVGKITIFYPPHATQVLIQTYGWEYATDLDRIIRLLVPLKRREDIILVPNSARSARCHTFLLTFDRDLAEGRAARDTRGSLLCWAYLHRPRT
jgi:hypothetical protein